jgi:hypothetical protein
MLANTIKRMVPRSLVNYYIAKRGEPIRAHFLSLDRNEQEDPEIVEIIHWFENNRFAVFPYDFTKKYPPEEIEVFVDETCKMKYVLHDNKRLYFPRYWSATYVRHYYNTLRIEQDKDSPHRYETADHTVKKGDIIADIGAAEGIWALTYAEEAEKIYLFECEPMWIDALKKTFAPWEEKVSIISRYVSNTSNGVHITLDDFMKKEHIDRIDFIKADIEGAERQLLEGADEVFLAQNDIKLILCTYHRKNDGTYIKEYLENKNFNTEYSKRYMLFIYDKELDIPYIRRGVIRATKNATAS